MKNWTIKRYDLEQVQSLARAARISDLVATLLIGRGITQTDAAVAFLGANLKDGLRQPSFLPGCGEVAERLYRAVCDKRKIVIYGDYDVDGITGIVILYTTLKELGADVSYYIPNRLDEGYGLNSGAVETLAQEGAKVIVTVDCGINSVEEARRAKECGIELLITDHHHVGQFLPEVPICHPDLPNTHYSCPHLCGAAVALKVAWAVAQLANEGLGELVSPKFRERLKQLLGLAALGTVADFVPLLDENRALVSGGLQFLTPQFASLGMKELLNVAKYAAGKQIDVDFVAFHIAPRINAAGRLGQAGLAVELLLATDIERAKRLANELNTCNENRRELESRIQREAEKQIAEKYDPETTPAFVLAGDWHRGVIGIVAGRLVEKYHRPVILFGQNKMKRGAAVGSARSVAGFDLYAAIEACQDLLERFGGHEGAAGLTVNDDKLDRFREMFCATVADRIPEEKRVAQLSIDGVFPLGAFTFQTIKTIQTLAPFGSGNPSPIFAAQNVTLQNVNRLGKEGRGISANFCQGGTVLRGINFQRGDWVEAMQPYDEPKDIALKVRISDYLGRNKPELDILDWRRTE